MAPFRVFTSPATWRSLLFLLSALPLGLLGLVLLVTGWSLTLSLAITPLVVPLLMGFAFAVRLLAGGEAWLARELLGADTEPFPKPTATGFWRRGLEVVTGRRFWKGQAYLGLRLVLGWTTAWLQLGLFIAAVAGIGAPIYYRWLPRDHTDGFRAWNVDTLPKSLLLVPAGLVLLVLAVHLIGPLGAAWRGIANGLLSGTMGDMTSASKARRRRELAIHGAAALGIELLLVAIWALTDRSYFWPVWTLLVLGLLVCVHAVVVWLEEQREASGRRVSRHALAIHVGIAAVFFLFVVGVWAASGAGYFWPAWLLFSLVLVAGTHWAVVALRGDVELARRVEHLEETRAGAVDVQESDLRRIERDLHDGAQARLVALGMSLGRAEQKLDSDPDSARELVAEARVGVEEALRELRDLARGIRPPVLADRGLAAAVAALADRSPFPVGVEAHVDPRPSGAVETAAYFVVAEALTNAAKHAHPDRVVVRLERRGTVLEVDVIDDGDGGANPQGGGLTGLRRRVEALDGSLSVTSPAGGPTVVHVELPCGS